MNTRFPRALLFPRMLFMPKLLGEVRVRKASFLFARGPGKLGFTLLELLVVLVIIGLLAGYVAPQH